MPTGRTVADGLPAPGGGTDEPEGQGDSVGAADTDRTGRNAGTDDGSGDDGDAWEPPSAAELERLRASLPPVEIQPWGNDALAVVLREGARVMDVRTALSFLSEDAAFEGVYGDVEFAVVFDMTHGTESWREIA